MSEDNDELESLRRENGRLRKLLKLTDAEAAPAHGAQAAWFDRSPGPVNASSSPQSKVHFFTALFGARKDVYAIRWENGRSGKSGWMSAVEGGWRKGSRSGEHADLPLTPEVLAAHLTGDIHIGLYPMLPGDQTAPQMQQSVYNRPRPQPGVTSRVAKAPTASPCAGSVREAPQFEPSRSGT